MKCEDCVHEKVCEGYSNCEEAGLCEPKRPHGKWIDINDTRIGSEIHVCSECKKKRVLIDTPYCLWCGTKMRKESEEVSKYEKPNKLKNFGNW